MPFEDQTELQPLDPSKGAKDSPKAVPVSGTARVGDTKSKPAPSDSTVANKAVQSPAPRSPAAASGQGNPPPQDGTVLQDPAEVVRARNLSKPLEDDFFPHVPGYRMLERLGQGTFGVVWHAREEKRGIDVAIKFFAHGANDQWLALQAEVKQLALLHADPGIVQLLDVEARATPPFFVMEYLANGSLADLLRQGPLPVKQAMRIFRQVAEAMAYVHAKGIRHCDLKPGNVLLDARGRAKVADFGQAQLSSSASPALGTFFYMAPEQADLKDQIPDTRWDVYGMGALVYAMLTGRPPREDSTLRHELENTADLSHRLERYREGVWEAARPRKHRDVPGVDSALAGIIDRCLEIDPEKRLRDAGAVLDALDQRTRIRRQRPMLWFALAGPLVLLLVLGGLIYFEARTMLDNFQHGHEQLVLKDAQIGAALIASVVQSQLDQRVGMVIRAAQERIPTIFQGQPKLDEQQREALADSIQYFGRNSFAGWALVDAAGNFRAGYNYPLMAPTTFFDRNFSWRQWFNGDKDMDPTAKGLYESYWATPGDKAAFLVSDPYITTTKGICLGISAPVYFDKQLVGVLVANLDLDAVNEWLMKARFDNGNAVLLNARGYCLLHSAEESPDLPEAARAKLRQAIRPAEGVQLPSFVGKNTAIAAVLADKEGNAAMQLDPILNDGRRYLVGYSPILKFGGGALVEFAHQEVMQPVAVLTGRLRLGAFVLLAVAVMLLLGLWVWFFRILRREERFIYA